MRDKIILGVTLSIVLLLTLVVYGVVDTNRGPSTARADRERAVRNGEHLFAQYCIQCHGPVGEGCIGPALNRNTWRPEIAGEANPDYDDGSYDFIFKTLERGRNSNQPGVQMPAWSIRENGSLNDQELDDLTKFIQYGDWNTVLESAASAKGLEEELPTYRGIEDKAQVARVKDTMLSKGCFNCHNIGKVGGAVGAELTDVGSRRSEDWLRRWIKDPKSVPASERGPNLWLVGATPTVPPIEGDTAAQPSPQATTQQFPMNATYMPTIPMTEEELNLMVEYLKRARTSTR